MSLPSKSGSPRRADTVKYFGVSTVIYNNQPKERTKCFIYTFAKTVKPVNVAKFIVSSSRSTSICVIYLKKLNICFMCLKLMSCVKCRIT